MTRVISLLVVLGIGVITLSGCSDGKSTPAGAGAQTGSEPVSTLKGTFRLPKGPVK